MSDEFEETGHDPFGRESPGARLRAARENRGLSLETAAEALGVSDEILGALEADDYGRLGAPVYVRGYLRKYARFLDLDGDELVRDYEREASPHDPEVRAHATSALPPQSGMRWLALAVATVVIVALVIGGIWAWRYLRHAQTARRAPSTAVSKTAIQPAAVTAASGKTAGSAVSPPVPPGAAASKSAAAQAGLDLVLSTHKPCWIEVTGVGGKRLYYNLAPSDKTLTFHADRGALKVFLGDADAVDVTVNGKAFPIPAGTRSGNTARFEVEPSTAPPAASAS